MPERPAERLPNDKGATSLTISKLDVYGRAKGATLAGRALRVWVNGLVRDMSLSTNNGAREIGSILCRAQMGICFWLHIKGRSTSSRRLLTFIRQLFQLALISRDQRHEVRYLTPWQTRERM